MKLQILSDLHLESSAFTLRVPSEADAVVLAGDIFVAARPQSVKAFRKLLDATGKPVLYIPGNHEYYHGSVENGESITDNLEDKHANLVRMSFRLWEACGLRFFGTPLWTDFRLLGTSRTSMKEAADGISDFHCVTKDGAPVTPAHYVHSHEQSRREISGAKAHVIITHWLPSAHSIHKKFSLSPLNPYFASRCEDLMGKTVKLWIHGHSHASADYVYNGTRVVCNPKGYNGVENPEFNPELVIDV